MGRALWCAPVIVLGLSAACGGNEGVERATGTPVVASTPSGAHLIAFVSESGETHVRVANQYGSDLRDLSDVRRYLNFYPSWSPDST